MALKQRYPGVGTGGVTGSCHGCAPRPRPTASPVPTLLAVPHSVPHDRAPPTMPPSSAPPPPARPPPSPAPPHRSSRRRRRRGSRGRRGQPGGARRGPGAPGRSGARGGHQAPSPGGCRAGGGAEPPGSQRPPPLTGSGAAGGGGTSWGELGWGDLAATGRTGLGALETVGSCWEGGLGASGEGELRHWEGEMGGGTGCTGSRWGW